ncbi:MAG TPA: ferritin-like domain-containing protein [Streptosporangiaceae bacterium]|nr:ferritin-like domain-containing protein [Streptosporangiaceae bacterium]
MTAGQAAAITALQEALAAEQAACYGYGVVGAYLPAGSAEQATAVTDWVAHMRARDQLTALISGRGGQPVAAAVAYQLPFPVTSGGTAQLLAATMEDAVARAYLTLVALPETGLRSLGAQQVRAAALRAESWRGTTEAFPGLPASSLRS